jgi:hypothetical protein
MEAEMFVRLATAGAIALSLGFVSLAQAQTDGWKQAGAWSASRPTIAPAANAATPESPLFREAALPPPALINAANVSGNANATGASPVAPTTNLGAVTAAYSAHTTAASPIAQTFQDAAAQQQLVQQVSAVSAGSGTLPNDHGQVWREYDISGYTTRVQGSEKPEAAVIDWIVRETGTEFWFSEPLGILSANRSTLKVYHTPEVQELVKGIVDRFNGGQPNPYAYGVRLLTVGSPSWRTKMHSLMRPVAVQTPGIQAWILSKEDAAIFVTELKKRSDYREYNSTSVAIYNGQKGALKHVKPTSYVKNILFSGDAFGSYQPELGQIEEGYLLEISPLVSVDGTIVDATVKCEVDQIEQLVPVKIEVPTQLNKRQNVEIQVPQLVSWRVHERFRWPADQVLVLSCGVVAKPNGGKPSVIGMPVVSNLPNVFDGRAPRADAMMLLEARGVVNAAQAAPVGSGTSTPAFQTGALGSYHGRY